MIACRVLRLFQSLSPSRPVHGLRPCPELARFRACAPGGAAARGSTFAIVSAPYRKEGSGNNVKMALTVNAPSRHRGEARRLRIAPSPHPCIRHQAEGGKLEGGKSGIGIRHPQGRVSPATFDVPERFLEHGDGTKKGPGRTRVLVDFGVEDDQYIPPIPPMPPMPPMSAAGHTTGLFLILGDLGDQRLGGEEQAGDQRRR